MFSIWYKREMKNDSVWDKGSRESDVGEVQSEDGFTCRSSKIRSQIEPRQYHLSLLSPPNCCFPAHPKSSDSLVRILLPTFINIGITNISLLVRPIFN